MSDEGTQLSNPFSTGGGGPRFEIQVQTAFVVLMLTGGVVPCLPAWPIKKIKLQGRYAGYDTDDFIVFLESQDGTQAKLLGQVKHTVSVTENDRTFGAAIKAAWRDFQNAEFFDPEVDVLALISGPLSATDNENARTILEWARASETAKEFLVDKMELANFSRDAKRSKLQAFRAQMQKANNGDDPGDERFWQFLKCYHLLGYDLDIRSGVTLSLLKSHIAQFTGNNTLGLWGAISNEVGSFNQDAGTVTPETISQEIRAAFSEQVRVRSIPVEFLKREEQEPATPQDGFSGEHANALMFASLIGAWNDKVDGDLEAVKALIADND